MRRPFALVSAGLAALGVYGALASRRRKPMQAPAPTSPGPDPRAEELRRKLAESRTIVEERETFEAAETTVDQAHAPQDPETRRRAVHETGRAAAERMRER